MPNSIVSYPVDPSTPTSTLPFSPCAVAGQLVFVSGQASVDARGTIVPDTFDGEFRRSLENLRLVLQAAGCTFADVIQTRNYLRDDKDLPRYNELYREYFQPPYPARATITRCLGAIQYEIEAVAVKPTRG